MTPSALPSCASSSQLVQSCGTKTSESSTSTFGELVKRIRTLAIVSACVGSLSIPAAAVAQQAAQAAAAPIRSNTEKLMLSVALGGTSIKSDDFENETESGGGFSIQVGWGFTRLFTLLVDASGAVMGNDDEEFVLAQGDLLGRFHFANPQRAWVPFVEGG